MLNISKQGPLKRMVHSSVILRKRETNMKRKIASITTSLLGSSEWIYMFIWFQDIEISIISISVMYFSISLYLSVSYLTGTCHAVVRKANSTCISSMHDGWFHSETQHNCTGTQQGTPQGEYEGCADMKTHIEKDKHWKDRETFKKRTPQVWYIMI